MNEFESYRKAHDEMEADPAVLAAREQDEVLRAKMMEVNELISDAEKPYRERMAEAETQIVDAVLAQGESVTLHDVRAKYTKGRASTSWKKVADACNPPAEIVEEHTKIGEPRVSVSVL